MQDQQQEQFKDWKHLKIGKIIDPYFKVNQKIDIFKQILVSLLKNHLTGE